MTRPTALEHFRYVGDKRTQVVYDQDLAGDDESVAAAVADIVATETFACFAPDTLAEARNRGYRAHRPRVHGVGFQSSAGSASRTPFHRPSNAVSLSAGSLASPDGSAGSPASETQLVQPP